MADLVKAVLAFFLRNILKIFYLFPLHRDRAVFFSYFGKQYACNPKAISEGLRRQAPDIEIYWAFRHPKDFPSLEREGIRLLPFGGLRFARYCLTSRYVVTNSELPAWLPLSRRQLALNTWHGGGAYKKVGIDARKPTLGKRLRSAMARSTPVLYLSSSQAFSRLTLRQSFRYRGPILPYGMPRNDLLFEKDRRDVEERVRRFFGLEEGRPLLLYAPTIREGGSPKAETLDLCRLQKVLGEGFGGEWIILYRLHYLTEGQALPEGVLDATGYPDMQELLYTASALLTDYSSSIWDFSFTGRPCFLYAPDLDYYQEKRGFYTDIHSWPYPLARTQEELFQNLLTFDPAAYREAMEDHHLALGSFEKGQATKQAVAYILAH